MQDSLLFHCNQGICNPGAYFEPPKCDFIGNHSVRELLWKKQEHCVNNAPETFRLKQKIHLGFFPLNLESSLKKNPILLFRQEKQKETLRFTLYCAIISLYHTTHVTIKSYLFFAIEESKNKTIGT